jgi:alpha-amylase
MVADLAVYTVVHQPRRLKLPAQPIPRGASAEEIAYCLFDERLNEHYFHSMAQRSYYPGVRLFLDLVRQGFKLSIGFSLSFIRQASAWDSKLLDLFRELVAHENVELIGVEPYHSFLFLLDLPAFAASMQQMANDLEAIFQKRPTVTDTAEMAMSAQIYNAIDLAGFKGAFMDGRTQVLDWRAPTYLYRYGNEAPLPIPITESRRRSSRKGNAEEAAGGARQDPFLLARHRTLSDDIGFRFSDRSWHSFPLYADTYADWIRQTQGDLVLLGWSFETFGGRQSQESGIFDFMRVLPSALTRKGVRSCTASELIERYQQQTYYVPLPTTPTIWAGDGDMATFTGSEAQKALLQSMRDTYSSAQLTGNDDLVDIARWLVQSDHLHALQEYWYYQAITAVEEYAAPPEWALHGDEHAIAVEQHVYSNALRAIELYMPTRVRRQPSRKPTRRRVAKKEPMVADQVG